MSTHDAAVTAPTLPDGYRFGALGPDDRRAVLELDTWTFPMPASVDQLMEIPYAFHWERFVGVTWDDPEPSDGAMADAAAPAGSAASAGEAASRSSLAAIHSSYPFTHFTVPGATLPVSGLTWVGVHPQHRRRGILRAMIARHFQDCVDRGESVSALFAAEAAIYGRFGYGAAAQDVSLTLSRGADLRDVPGAEQHTVRLEVAEAARHADLVFSLHEQAGAAPGFGTLPDGLPMKRPGWAIHETQLLRDSFFSDPEIFRKGGESRRIAIVSHNGSPRGYATFRRTLDWEQAGPRGKVKVTQFVAVDAAAARALWGVLTDLDLTATIEADMIATDDPIFHLVTDPRALTPKVNDNVWVRIIDVATALAGRQYSAPIDVVLDVTDANLPANQGRWRLRSAAFGPATVERTDAPADLVLDIRELSTAYLGGVPLGSLAAAGQVMERSAGALAKASAAYLWPVAPLSNWVF